MGAQETLGADDQASLVHELMRLIFAYFAHAYLFHYAALEEAGLAALLNGSFQHFLLVSDEFSILKDVDFHPVGGLIDRLSLDLFVRVPCGRVRRGKTATCCNELR